MTEDKLIFSFSILLSGKQKVCIRDVVLQESLQIIDNSMQSASATEQQSFISFITFAVIALEIYLQFVSVSTCVDQSSIKINKLQVLLHVEIHLLQTYLWLCTKEKYLFKICCRVPAAEELEKWKLSFSHVMNSEGKFILKN